jgi:hypothetical protein
LLQKNPLNHLATLATLVQQSIFLNLFCYQRDDVIHVVVVVGHLKHANEREHFFVNGKNV